MPQVEPTPLTPTDPGPVMISWAHRPNTGDPDRPISHEESDAWRDTVLRFVTVLRWECGVTAELDLFHLSEEWTRWGPLQVQQCPWTLVVVNAAWRERFEGRNKPTEGAGAVAEANVLHGLFQQNPDDFHRRVVLVVLPGASEDDVPLQLRGVQRFTIPELTVKGLEGLLRHLTKQPLYVPPPVGTVPVLPPETVSALEDLVQEVQPASLSSPVTLHLPTVEASADSPVTASGTGSLTGDGTLSAEGVAEPASVKEERVALQAWAAGVQYLVDSAAAALSAELAKQLLYAEEAADHRWLGALLEESVTVLERRRLLSAVAAPASAPEPDPRTAAVQRLDELLRGVSAHLKRDNRCWLLLAGTLLAGAPLHPGDGPSTSDGRSMRRRREDQVSGWLVTRPPPVDLGNYENTVRASGRVVFTGNPGESRTAGQTSTHWRLELADLGDAVAAANVAGEVSVPPDVGTIGFPGEPGQVLLDTELSLPVRRDLLEMWLLTQVELIADHLRATATAREAVFALQAQLLLPARLTRPATHHSTVLGVRLVDEYRDEDGHPRGERAPYGAVALPLDTAPPTTSVSTITLVGFMERGAQVRLAHGLAVQLLEHFGVEDAAVLRPNGTVDELGAAAADQQRLYQHACTLNLEVDPVSPERRRQRYDELLAQARAALRR